MTVTPVPARRYDLDWLRIVVFGLLILYHIGMFYVPWDWHVKSTHAPVDALQIPMRLSNSWRLPLLFFISGVALRYVVARYGSRGLVRSRLWRLGLPLLFGMLVICAPQAFFELRQDGVDPGGLLAFYGNYLLPPWVTNLGLPLWVEALGLITVTGLICVGTYHFVICHLGSWALLFGAKAAPR